MSDYIKKHGEVIPQDTRTSVSLRYRTVTRAVNNEFWSSASDTAHSFYVGSYGRGTAIDTSDIDILVEIPQSEYQRYDYYHGNGQSRLLQAVKNAILTSNKLLANYFFACNGRVYHCDCIEDNVGVVGTFYPEARLYEEVAQAFYERNIFSNSKCAVCAYKFVCLGGCPLGARVKGEETDCSIFGDEEILDNLEFDDNLVFNKRWREKNHETDKEPGNY